VVHASNQYRTSTARPTVQDPLLNPDLALGYVESGQLGWLKTLYAEWLDTEQYDSSAGAQYHAPTDIAHQALSQSVEIPFHTFLESSAFEPWGSLAVCDDDIVRGAGICPPDTTTSTNRSHIASQMSTLSSKLLRQSSF
jgi:hypothetical protein